MGKNLDDLGFGRDFLNIIQKVPTIKKSINKLDIIKMGPQQTKNPLFIKRNSDKN